MSDKNELAQSEFEQLSLRIEVLERRILFLENGLGVAAKPKKEASAVEPSEIIEEEEGTMESRVGGFGLALLGNIVLLFGIVFISQYIQSLGHPLYSALFGLASVGLILFLSHYTRKSFTQLSTMFRFISHMLLYYVVLSLHYFTEFPVINNEPLSLSLLLVVVAYTAYSSLRKKSEFYASITIILLVVTAIVSNTTHFMLSLTIFIAAGTVFLYFKYGWQRLVILSLFLVYGTFLVWLAGNSNLMKNPGVISFHNFSHLYLLVIAGIFSLITLVPQEEMFKKGFIFSSVVINGFFFSLVLGLSVLAFFLGNYSGLFISISLYSIIFSVILQFYSKWEFSPAFYALYGFIAISITVYGYFGLPLAYLWLSLQSLLVVSMALWFRSKTIVSMNAVLFLLLLIAYVTSSAYLDLANFAFALVSFATARILNWKKQRLDIKTEILRNLYLICAFFLTLFALYKFIPDKYITLSWTIAAIIYFVLSLLLHNVKYRWMAIFTMISAAIYLFIVDLSRISVLYRIFAFLFLAIISIGISIYYAKKRKKISSNEEDK